MKILLVYPHIPDSFWSFRYALRFISKKASMPPLGLVTIAAMLPGEWEKRVVDLNVEGLHPGDVQWADYVFISAMNIQRDSVGRILKACGKANVKTVGGGPLFTQSPNAFPEIDHLILNEAEITLPLFLDDLAAGRKPSKVYSTGEYADITKTPVPLYNLLSRKAYAYMSIQISRGCPFACDFCEITSLLGHKVRMKETRQVLDELEELYRQRWRGPVFIVDDNFIGNKKVIKQTLLPAMNSWMKEHRHPFIFTAEASIDLADDDELLRLMVDTGFKSVFIGIETPEEQSLVACNKMQNKDRDLLGSVRKIQQAGLLVSGGFIVGFDTDSPSVFRRQTEFIQQSGIVSAMVGLLNAPRNTRLYHRLAEEGRIIHDSSGNNTDLSLNFIPRMDRAELIAGYNGLIKSIYAAKPYYQRIRTLLRHHRPRATQPKRINFAALLGFLRSILIIGIVEKGRFEYWKMILWALMNRPGSLVDAIEYTIYGYHFRRVFNL
ncbi:MAG: B12-binding domain-containing radical SAM protein [Bacteroidales bacterium]